MGRVWGMRPERHPRLCQRGPGHSSSKSGTKPAGFQVPAWGCKAENWLGSRMAGLPFDPLLPPTCLRPTSCRRRCEPGGWLPRSRCDWKDSQSQSAFSMLVLSLEMELTILPARIFCGSEQSQSKRHRGSLEVSVLEPEPPSAP